MPGDFDVGRGPGADLPRCFYGSGHPFGLAAPLHRHVPADLCVESCNDRIRRPFRLADVLFRACGLGNELLRLPHHLVPQLVAIAAPGQPRGLADLPSLRAGVVYTRSEQFGQRKLDRRSPASVVFGDDLGSSSSSRCTSRWRRPVQQAKGKCRITSWMTPRCCAGPGRDQGRHERREARPQRSEEGSDQGRAARAWCEGQPEMREITPRWQRQGRGHRRGTHASWRQALCEAG